jgi:hypothetical protein
MTNKITQTKLATRELLLCYTNKKVTSKLYKLTKYKSNYTSTMYMKVNTSLCCMKVNHREDDEDNVDTVIFLLRFTCLPTRYVPVVLTNTSWFARLIGIPKPSPPKGRHKNLPQVW